MTTLDQRGYRARTYPAVSYYNDSQSSSKPGEFTPSPIEGNRLRPTALLRKMGVREFGRRATGEPRNNRARKTDNSISFAI
jgi:hypothetical protein